MVWTLGLARLFGSLSVKALNRLAFAAAVVSVSAALLSLYWATAGGSAKQLGRVNTKLTQPMLAPLQRLPLLKSAPSARTHSLGGATPQASPDGDAPLDQSPRKPEQRLAE